ncbi:MULTISPECIES: hypothetical protein [Bacillaceae]|uniref:Luciferase-like monooxygenase n=1 Tax=Peribacillus simplex TaxID=1478 RepID=A0AAN2PIR8_9BACI|nr:MULTISPECIES: hypothetical protein [Bacillaceae]MCT1392044.1 hypothetical protein [Peribacillus frigoritolerans]CEG33021.1 luciferase-like monooxygenase [Peribacillus simplex]
MSFQNHRAYNSMYQKDKMTLGFILPTARMSKNPIMENQLELARKIEEYGFASLWLRDITMQDLNIDDNGQKFDLWIYLYEAHCVSDRKCSSTFAPPRQGSQGSCIN